MPRWPTSPTGSSGPLGRTGGSVGGRTASTSARAPCTRRLKARPAMSRRSEPRLPSSRGCWPAGHLAPPRHGTLSTSSGSSRPCPRSGPRRRSEGLSPRGGTPCRRRLSAMLLRGPISSRRPRWPPSGPLSSTPTCCLRSRWPRQLSRPTSCGRTAVRAALSQCIASHCVPATRPSSRVAGVRFRPPPSPSRFHGQCRREGPPISGASTPDPTCRHRLPLPRHPHPRRHRPPSRATARHRQGTSAPPACAPLTAPSPRRLGAATTSATRRPGSPTHRGPCWRCVRVSRCTTRRQRLRCAALRSLGAAALPCAPHSTVSQSAAVPTRSAPSSSDLDRPGSIRTSAGLFGLRHCHSSVRETRTSEVIRRCIDTNAQVLFSHHQTYDLRCHSNDQ
eukprot:m.305567 g.305567  ORF g.305567 m.305567 type:complete len:392 (+) comp27345_c0_seq1:2043-3218(+)